MLHALGGFLAAFRDGDGANPSLGTVLFVGATVIAPVCRHDTGGASKVCLVAIKCWTQCIDIRWIAFVDRVICDKATLSFNNLDLVPKLYGMS